MRVVSACEAPVFASVEAMDVMLLTRDPMMSFRQARGKIALIRVASAILPESFLPSSNSYLAEHDAQWIVRLAMSLFWSNAANCLIRGFSHTPRAIFFRSSVIQTGPACLGHQLQTFASTAAVLQKSETAETQEKEAKNVAEAQNQDRKDSRVAVLTQLVDCHSVLRC